MPQPTSSQVHVNRLLTNLSVAYIQETDKFAALKVFPGLNVTNKTNKYATYSKDDFLRDEMVERAPSTESAGGGYAIDLNSDYLCKRYSFHVDEDWDTEANADDPLNPATDAALYLSQKSLIKLEVLFATQFFTTGVWTGGTKAAGTAGDLVAGTDFVPWDDVSSTPIEDVDAQKESIEGQTGYLPNMLTMSRPVWNSLRNHPDIVDRVKHTSSEAVATGIVARLMELDSIVIGAAVRNTVAKGLPGTTSYIFGKHALLTYSPSSVSLRRPLAGLTFRWTGLRGSVDGSTVSSFDMPNIKSTRHEIEMNIDMEVVAPTVGAFFSGAAS